MKEKILKLRAKGKSYREIEEILGCSKGTISYHCGEGQKQKWQERQRRNRKRTINIIKAKLEKFVTHRVRDFKKREHKGRWSRGYGLTKSRFNYDSAYRKISNNPTCFLTGRKIDLSNSASYQLDHIVPVSKGGKNELKNMGLASKDANLAKGNLSVQEFVELCKEVCQHNGYEVNKLGA